MSQFSQENQPKKRGRPTGAKSKRLSEFRRDGNALLNRLMLEALEGNDEAAKMVLSFLPKPKPEKEKIQFDVVGETLFEKTNSIVSAIAGGVISTDTGCQLLSALGSVAKIVAVTELVERIEKLEALEAA